MRDGGAVTLKDLRKIAEWLKTHSVKPPYSAYVWPDKEQ